MNRIKIVLLIAVVVFASPAIVAQGFLKADGQRIVDGKGRNILLRGVGLGGWMLQEGYMLRLRADGQQQFRIRQRIEALLSKEQTQEFYDVWLSHHTTKADIDSLKKWGFNSVRLPMHYNLYTLPIEDEPEAGKNTWLKKGFDLTDSLLSWCKKNGMYLILDLHAAPGGQGNDLNISDRDPSKPALWQSERNQEKMIALWKELANRYKSETMIAGYDIINEPNWGFADTTGDRNGLKEKGNEPLRKLMMDITKAIREVDKNHIIIIEGNGWGNNYSGILPVWDNNMVLSFHKYWNNNDEKSIRGILDIRTKNNVPVWLGETGENSNTWYMEAVRLLEENNIGWAWWPLKKLGSNNPLEIRSNHNYDNLIDYWNGKRPNPPKESDVYSGLLEMATYSRIGSNIIHRDVIDALIRQPHAKLARAFKSTKISDGSTVNAVDYDLGANGIAYYDKDTANYGNVGGKQGVGNKGHIYRNDGVDIYKDSTRYETYYVGSIEEGEWLQFTVNVTKAGMYSISFETSTDNNSSTNTSGSLYVVVDGKKLGGDIELPATGSYKEWKSVSSAPFYLQQGSRQIRVYASNGGFNLCKLQFKLKK